MNYEKNDLIFMFTQSEIFFIKNYLAV